MNPITQHDHHTMPAAVMLSAQSSDRNDAAIAQQRFVILAARMMSTHEAKFDGAASISIHADDMSSIILLEPDSGVVRIFTDLGLPHQDDRLSVYEAALHYNLPIGFQAASIGLHPVSSRLVVTSALPVLMRGDICAKTEQLLTITRDCAKDFRCRFTTFQTSSFE